MNKNVRSSFESAISILNKSKNLGVRIKFVLHRGAIGQFSLEGNVEEISEVRFLFRGEGCIALLDWETCPLKDVEDLTTAQSKSSFNFRFVLDGDNFFFVTGIDPVPTDVVN